MKEKLNITLYTTWEMKPLDKNIREVQGFQINLFNKIWTDFHKETHLKWKKVNWNQNNLFFLDYLKNIKVLEN